MAMKDIKEKQHCSRAEPCLSVYRVYDLPLFTAIVSSSKSVCLWIQGTANKQDILLIRLTISSIRRRASIEEEGCDKSIAIIISKSLLLCDYLYRIEMATRKLPRRSIQYNKIRLYWFKASYKSLLMRLQLSIIDYRSPDVETVSGVLVGASVRKLRYLLVANVSSSSCLRERSLFKTKRTHAQLHEVLLF